MSVQRERLPETEPAEPDYYDPTALLRKGAVSLSDPRGSELAGLRDAPARVADRVQPMRRERKCSSCGEWSRFGGCVPSDEYREVPDGSAP